ncbi:hypothetical protein AB0N17_32340 [Streptomyces sp. NPDC051133]|uniref:hypothetical protein n=1 Tax=Streptomyces sp. NPDC051133 TaxID=3155521 RepID=UPI00343092DA
MRAILAHDGGQTALRYLDLIDVKAITADPKPILAVSVDAAHQAASPCSSHGLGEDARMRPGRPPREPPTAAPPWALVRMNSPLNSATWRRRRTR